MAYKTIKTRIGLKYDLYANWYQTGTWSNGVFTPDASVQTTYASGFTPLKGEVIFFEIPASTHAVVQEPAILFKVGDGQTTLANLPWGSAIAADVYGWAKNQSLLGGTESSGTWTWSTDGAYAQEQAEVAAFVKRETADIRVKVDQVTVQNFQTIYGIPYDSENPDHVDRIGKYQVSVSTDGGTTWTASGAPFAIQITNYTAGSGIDISQNNEISVKTKTGGMIENTDDGQGTDTGIDVVKSTVTYTAAQTYTQEEYDAYVTEHGEAPAWNVGDVKTPANITGTTGVLTDQAVNPFKMYIDAKSASNAVNVVKQGTAETGYAATYIITQNGEQVGVKINIPKDFLVKSADLINVIEHNGQYYDETDTGYTNPLPVSAAGKYIDFTVNTVDGDENAQHIYLAVNDLVDVYTAGNTTYINMQIDSNNQITATANVIPFDQAHNTQYNFTSWSAVTGGEEYATGVAELVAQTENSTEVVIVSNSIEGWVGRHFTIGAVILTPGTRYQISEDGHTLPVWVEISGDPIPAVDGLATANNVKTWVLNKLTEVTPNIEEGDGIEITDGQNNSKTISVKLDGDQNDPSGLKVSSDGLAIDDTLTFVLFSGGVAGTDATIVTPTV